VHSPIDCDDALSGKRGDEVRAWWAVLFAALAIGCSPGGPSSAADEPSASRIEQASIALQAVLIDSGATRATSAAAFSRVAMSTRDDVQASHSFARLGAARQAELLAFIDGFPASATETVMQNAPNVIQEFAPRLATMLDEDALRELTNYYRSAPGKSWMLRAAVAEIEGNQVTPTPEEERAIAEFSTTRAGRALTDEFNQLLRDAGYRMISAVSDQINASLRDGVCSRIECEATGR
jgi:hypothetical protein